MNDTHTEPASMSACVISRECMADAHELCPGHAEIRRSEAPYWEPPLATPDCGCTACGHEGAR